MKSVIQKRHTLIGLAALTVALIANTASAQPLADTDYKTVNVQYSDLDLSQPAGARRLYGRIKSAAEIACDNYSFGDLPRLAKYKQCRDQAIANAVAQVKSPQLTSIHEAEMQRLSKG
jgi:UrcA family protein